MLHEPEQTIALCSDATKRFLLAAKHAEITVLEQLSSNCRIVIAVRELIHELQKERGASNIFLASKGERYTAERMQYVSASEQAESMLKSHLKSLYLTDEITTGNPRLLSSITLAMQATDYLPSLREQISKQLLTPLESTRAYSRLVASLLTVIFEAADIASDPTITRLLVALFNFMQAKEYAGQERAWGAIGFAETHFDVRLCEKLAALQYAQDHHFSIFCEFSCKPHKDALDALNKSPAAIDITQLRNMIAQLGDGSPIAGEISEVWFDVATRRMDAMQTIEVALTEALTQQANSKVADAKNEMANHQQLLTRFNDEHATDGSPLTLLFDPSMPGLAEDSKEDEIKTLSLNEQTKTLSAHRSFYDLLRSQAQHIEDMGRELEEAKRAIQEQKLIGRAKLVVMEQFGLSENNAYRRLQKQAMSENTTIAAIAAKIVNITTKTTAQR
ncbi:nitrate-and nitrite-responsive positive regulator [Alteromonas macleodii]|uniref:Nitrate-and nitrite-responsive positive regulator n=1 Tax=Alteromonas macleodii TaxID=28108 RepID=A0A126PY96_ALTMA|nr:nitrate regulatory protein [Alteromonas macleodii]AMJ97208.1 nitrate-and nitrite-responsive positive regulator [Alteromonas macleodii]